MNTVTAKPSINGKEIEIVATCGVNDKYGGIELAMYVKIMMIIIKEHDYDMYVIEMCDENHFQVRLAGYRLNGGELDEKSIVYKSEKSLHVEKMFFKIDDYGDKYVGTFLFPSEW